MAATILTADHYDAVRALIAPNITSAHISDAYLGQLPIVPEAERNIRKRLARQGIVLNADGTRNEKTGDAISEDVQEDILLAMIHECMVVLSIVIPQQTREDMLEIVTEVQKIDWKAKQAFHIGEVDEKLSNIVDTLTPATSSVQGRSLPMGPVGTQRTEIQDRTPRYYRRVPIG